MDRYKIINLDEIISLNEELLLKPFKEYTPKYKEQEVYDYLNKYAILNNKEGFSKTYLLIDPNNKELIIYGYFTIAIKSIQIKNLSKTNKKKILGNMYPNIRKVEEVPAYLIGQISINNQYNILNKNEIIECCLDVIKQIRSGVGCNLIILECKNENKLIKYYENNGFKVYTNNKIENELLTMIKRIE